MNSPSHLLARLEIEAHQSWMNFALAGEDFFMQKSRVEWIKVGDCNSVFFHKMVASIKTSNHIHYLLDFPCQHVESPLDVQSLCVNYFSGLFGEMSGSSNALKLFEIRISLSSYLIGVIWTPMHSFSLHFQQKISNERSLHCLQLNHQALVDSQVNFSEQFGILWGQMLSQQ